LQAQNGNIFVFTAMLELCSSDDELGIILGHEIAHSLLGHAVHKIKCIFEKFAILTEFK